MKKVLAFAFVATMATFASCTSKPAETEQVEVTVETPEVVVEEAADSTATDVAPDSTVAAPAAN